MLVLIGVLVVVVGFATRRPPLLVIAVAGIVTGLLGQAFPVGQPVRLAGVLGRLAPMKILAAFGNGFASSRAVTVFVITLPVIGLLERYGLQEQGRRLIAKAAGLTTGRFLALYMLFRQVSAAVGLLGIGGPAQAVRPLVAPMAEGAAERRHGPLPEKVSERVKSFAASADTVGLFFGEDIFLAVGSILLITGYVNATYHTQLEPLSLALWAIPTAVCAFLIHGWRLLRLDNWLSRELGAAPVTREPAPVGGPGPAYEDAPADESARAVTGGADADSKGAHR